MHVLSAIHQYVAANICLKKDFVKGGALPLPILPQPWSTLGISGRNHYQNGSIPSKAFCLWSSLWILLALPWIHPRADLIKRLNTYAGHENVIPTKFHKHPSSGSVVKADYVCSHIYTCISAPPPPLPSPKFIHNNFIIILQAYLFFILAFSQL